MANNTNINDMLTVLPVELRILILEFVLEDSRLWVGHYRARGQAPTVIRRFISADEPEGTHPPHSLFYVNHQIADEIRRLWERRFNHRLQVDWRLTSFPPQIFSGITHLSLTMQQAATSLQVVIPHVPRNYGRMLPPTTELVLAHGLRIQHLDIRWAMPFHFDDGHPNNPHNRPMNPPRTFQNALVRLQYFRTSFQVTIHYQATYEGAFRASGTITPTNRLRTFDDYTFRYHDGWWGSQAPWIQHIFEQQLREFGWDPAMAIHRNTPQWDALIAVHPNYEHVPLGWQRPQAALPQLTPGAAIFVHPGGPPRHPPPGPSTQASGSQNLPPRSGHPRQSGDDDDDEDADADEDMTG